MKICIPIEVRPEGGMFTFIGNFLEWLKRAGQPYTQDIRDEYDVLFVNSFVVPFEDIFRVKQSRPQVRVVHRVDGSTRDYGRIDSTDDDQSRANLLADRTVFQSRYAKFSVTEKYRVIMNDGPVIHNPVDIRCFTPVGPSLAISSGRPRVMTAAFSVNRMKGTWKLDHLAETNPDIDFVLCGRFEGIQPRANVHFLGHLNRVDLSVALRSGDVFVNLSENDPCPNVVTEALASGLPVLYKDSGGVRELVGDCGSAFELDEFRACLNRLLASRDALGSAARCRAEQCFAPDVIFPKYLAAIESAERRQIPAWSAGVGLALRGYPAMLLPGRRTPGQAIAALRRHSPDILRRVARRASRPSHRVGWITYDSFPNQKRRFRDLDSFTGMRAGNVARWINAHDRDIANELYVPGRRYDVVIFQKMMNGRCQMEAERIQSYGGKVIFDANVNYYETWGDYFIPGTQPKPQEQQDAIRMTKMADWVVADSTNLGAVIARFNPRMRCIPDNVDIALYHGARDHGPAQPVRLVWCGIGKKAAHLLLIKDVLAKIGGIELVLVADEEPACLRELREVVPCTLVPFSDKAYAATLRSCDVIISPKRLVNAYEMAHTEYKITLGMAVGLPAVASPQLSYVEAIGHHGGGFVADGPDEWHDALTRLVSSPGLRADLGARARQTVAERYATPVVASTYLGLLRTLVGLPLLSVS
jgi:glycosyltransferase involved in cell wall biosynthesis